MRISWALLVEEPYRRKKKPPVVAGGSFFAPVNEGIPSEMHPGQSCTGHAPDAGELRKHESQRSGLQIGQKTEYQSHGDAVPDSESEEIAFLPYHVGCRGSYGKRLRRNHFCGDAARSVGCHGQFRRHAHSDGRIFLHAAEKSAGRGV